MPFSCTALAWAFGMPKIMPAAGRQELSECPRATKKHSPQQEQDDERNRSYPPVSFPELPTSCFYSPSKIALINPFLCILRFQICSPAGSAVLPRLDSAMPILIPLSIPVRPVQKLLKVKSNGGMFPPPSSSQHPAVSPIISLLGDPGDPDPRFGLPRTEFAARNEACGLFSLSSRRMIADLCFVHSCYSQTMTCRALNFAKDVPELRSLRCHRLLSDQRPHIHVSRLLPNRLALKWNSLPQNFVSCSSATFKARCESEFGHFGR